MACPQRRVVVDHIVRAKEKVRCKRDVALHKAHIAVVQSTFTLMVELSLGLTYE